MDQYYLHTSNSRPVYYIFSRTAVTIVGPFFFVQKMSDGVNHLATLQQSTIPHVDGQLQTIFFPAGVGHVSF